MNFEGLLGADFTPLSFENKAFIDELLKRPTNSAENLAALRAMPRDEMALRTAVAQMDCIHFGVHRFQALIQRANSIANGSQAAEEI